VKVLLRALALSVIAAIAATAAHAIETKEKRIALVIGIGAYKYANTPPLANPPNDARRIAEALRRLNFEVDERIDPDFRTMSDALRHFGIRAQSADAAVVFYAGHGVQVDHENYLIPADAKLEREHDLLYEALPLDLFLDEVSGARKVGIIMLDACRNNPFTDRISRSLSFAARGAAAEKGLARVDRVPRNTLVAMATRADEVAEDGSGQDSPFTQAILANLQIPGLELSLFFRSVRDAVLKATNYRQEPYVFSSLGAEAFYFNPLPPNRPPVIGDIMPLELADRAGPTPLGLPRPTDPDNDPLTVRIVELPKAGELISNGKPVGRDDILSLENFMTARYKPDGKTVGPVGSIDFVVDDGRGGTAKGRLPITVVSTNHPPVVEAARAVTIFPGALGIMPPTDPDGDPLTVTITELPSHGVVRNGNVILRTGDGLRPEELSGLVFQPDPGTEGKVGGLRYSVDDGRGGKVEGKLDVVVAGTGASRDLFSEEGLWDRIQRQGGRGELESFLTLFPGSRYADSARAKLAADFATETGSTAPRLAVVESARHVSGAKTSSTAQMPTAGTAVTNAAASAPPPEKEAPAAAKEIALAAPSIGVGGRTSSETFQDCPNCPVMRRLPGGGFNMGVEHGDPSASPMHRVTVRPFAIGQYPVTVAEWRACVLDGGCSSTPRMVHPADRTPVHNLSWDDAEQYVAWIARKTGAKYRLPSEAEWEYAARGNTQTSYWWGDEPGVALANCSDCGGKQDRFTPLPVDAFRANPFGLYDINGGVAEWVADCWYPNYQGAPPDGSVRDRKACQSRVLRGGSFRNDHTNITATNRNFYDASVRYLEHGFRVALSLE
jgi:formylglycine-generating enzyme required for sulfatase activity